MKKLLFVLVVFLIVGCGGGGVVKTEPIVSDPPIAENTNETTYDFDIDISAKEIDQGIKGYSTEYKFEIRNYPDIKNLEVIVLIDDDVFVRMFTTYNSGDDFPKDQDTIEARANATTTYYTKIKLKTVKFKLREKNAGSYMTEKSVDISNIEIETLPPITNNFVKKQ